MKGSKWTVLSVCVFAIVLVMLIRPTMMTRRHATVVARKAHVRHIVNALEEYCKRHGAMPERVTEGKQGNVAFQHSWRAALLPYLTAPETAARYNFTEAWDSANNSEVSNALDSYSTFVNDAVNVYFLAIPEGSSEPPADCASIRVVSIPMISHSWNSPDDVTYDDVWKAILNDPDLVLLGINGGCVFKLGKVAKTKEECIRWLERDPIDVQKQIALYESLVASSAVDDIGRRCLREVLKKLKNENDKKAE